MKYSVIVGLLICVFLSGCAQTPVPYRVVKDIDHESKLLPKQFQFGVTQERLDEKQYRITAKLNDLGTPERARAMAFYHSSLLTEKQGFNAFIVNRLWHASSCGSAGGGPTFKMEITLVNSEEAPKGGQLHRVKDTKNSNKKLIDTVLTEVELAQISAERLIEN